jgi:hypothetical protein
MGGKGSGGKHGGNQGGLSIPAPMSFSSAAQQVRAKPISALAWRLPRTRKA